MFKRLPPPTAHFGLLLMLLFAVSGCRLEKQLDGQVVDFATGLPLADARLSVLQTGWGLVDGSLVWDKTYRSTAYSDRQGNFRIAYRVGSSANLQVSLDGYLSVQGWYPANSTLRIRLKAEQPASQPLPNGFLRLGQTADGRFYGWNFRQAERVLQQGQADVLPVSFERNDPPLLRLQASAGGGLRFIPQAEIGVDHQFLLYTDLAPETGYRKQLQVDFNDPGGVLFVRCRDGQTYAKIEINPSAFARTGKPEENRDLTLRYVYNPSGGRKLLYQGEGPNLPYPVE